MIDFNEQREYMVERQLLSSGVLHPSILKAARQIPREKFLPENLQHLAYIDDDILFDSVHYMMRPSDLMRMIQALEIKMRDRVLDVGCTMGYSSLILSYLAKRVIGLEELEKFVRNAHELVEDQEITNVKFILGSYSLGYVNESPYDAILVQRAFSYPPESLLEQLTIGGRLVYIQQTSEHYGQAHLLEKLNNHISERVLFELCVPYFNKSQTRFVF